MSRLLVRVCLVVAACCLFVLTVAHGKMIDVDAELNAMQLQEPEMRDVVYVDNMAQELGLVELDADSDADAEAEADADTEADADSEESADGAADSDSSLVEVGVVAPINFVMDEADANHHVMVEAYSESGMSTMKAEKKEKKSLPQPAEKTYNGTPLNSDELLPIRTAPKPGQAPLRNTFRDAPVATPKGESSKVIGARLKRAKQHLKNLAKQEHQAARDDYLAKQRKFEYARAADKGRQSRKFERALPPNAPVLPHPSSNAATFNGDRNHNVLFPAATAKSDGKATSQDHDFQHRGDGDAYADHTNLVEHGAQTTQQVDAEAQAEAQALARAKAELDASAAALAAAQAEADAAAETEASSEAEFQAHLEAEHQAQAAADLNAANDAEQEGETETEAEAEGDAEAEVAAEGEGEAEAAAATEEAPAEEAPAEEAAAAEPTEAEAAAAAFEKKKEADEAAGAPLIVKEPCAEQCDPVGAWRTAACQDCIVRGMVNGWIVKSIVDKQKGYNYAHYARNKCVAYANELHLRSDEVKGAPFAHCFFQKIHETCNL